MELWCYILRHSRFKPMTSHLRIHQPLPKYLQTINALSVAGLPLRQLDKISARLSGLSHSAPSAFSIRCQPCDTSSIFTDCRFQRSRREKKILFRGKNKNFRNSASNRKQGFRRGGKIGGGREGPNPPRPCSSRCASRAARAGRGWGDSARGRCTEKAPSQTKYDCIKFFFFHLNDRSQAMTMTMMTRWVKLKRTSKTELFVKVRIDSDDAGKES